MIRRSGRGGIAARMLKLVGTGEAEVYRHFKFLLEDESMYHTVSDAFNPYGNGYASQRIADILEGYE